jgi:predicted nucleotidyltransferase
MIPEITISQEQIAAFCRKHHIRKLPLFGSVLRDDFRDGSDIDVLVEFEPDARVGLMEMSRMQEGSCANGDKRTE